MIDIKKFKIKVIGFLIGILVICGSSNAVDEEDNSLERNFLKRKADDTEASLGNNSDRQKRARLVLEDVGLIPTNTTQAPSTVQDTHVSIEEFSENGANWQDILTQDMGVSNAYSVKMRSLLGLHVNICKDQATEEDRSLFEKSCAKMQALPFFSQEALPVMYAKLLQLHLALVLPTPTQKQNMHVIESSFDMCIKECEKKLLGFVNQESSNFPNEMALYQHFIQFIVPPEDDSEMTVPPLPLQSNHPFKYVFDKDFLELKAKFEEFIELPAPPHSDNRTRDEVGIRGDDEVKLDGPIFQHFIKEIAKKIILQEPALTQWQRHRCDILLGTKNCQQPDQPMIQPTAFSAQQSLYLKSGDFTKAFDSWKEHLNNQFLNRVDINSYEAAYHEMRSTYTKAVNSKLAAESGELLCNKVMLEDSRLPVIFMLFYTTACDHYLSKDFSKALVFGEESLKLALKHLKLTLMPSSALQPLFPFDPNADYERNLKMAHELLGTTHKALGQEEQARNHMDILNNLNSM